jgi:translation initiation factor IF-2
VVIDIFDGMLVNELADRLSQSPEAVKTVLTGLGEHGSQVVTADAAELVALDFGFSVKKLLKHEGSAGGELPRSPVVTVMGHVDHGKTTLLDALRQTSLAAREAGGITQHLGAFVVAMPSGASLTFLDTPGHAAFSSMRARGTAVTDIVVLVVAADDGVMPQTLEAMSLAQDAGVPVVVALTKCDRVEADPARVRQQLVAQGVELEEIGGDVQVVEVSAVTKSGLEKLEEALLLQAELMELRASSCDELHAVVVEARVDRGRGPLATVVVRSGNLVPGAIVVIGTQWGRIRVLKDMLGRPVPSAGPSTPVEIDGLRGLPEAGDYIQIVASEERARRLSQVRRTRVEEKRMWQLKRRVVAAAAGAEEGAEESAAFEKREMTVIVKADVQGTAEAVSQALTLLSCPQVEVNIVHSAVGPVSQSDVDLAASCRALIVGFNVGSMSSAISTSARLAKVQVLKHRVIYHLLEEVGALIVGMAPGVKEDQVAGEAEVLSVFELKGKGRTGKGATKIAGCRVVDGRLERAARIRVVRSGEVLFEGLMLSLKREQQDVDTVAKGVECGMILEEWVNFQVGDVVQCITDFRRMPKFVSAQNGAARIEC